MRIFGLKSGLYSKSWAFIGGVTLAIISTVLGSSRAIALSEESAACNPLRLTHCALPFPSDFYTAPDSTRRTGVRLEIPDEVLPPEVLSELPDVVHPTHVYTGADGFSAMSAVLFELPSYIDAAGLPTHASDSVFAVDMTTGERLPVYAWPSKASKSPLLADTQKDEVLEVLPRSRWPFGHRIAVAITRNVRTARGESMPISPRFKAALNPDADAYPLISAALQAVEAQGVSREELIDITAFTVRSESNATHEMLQWTQKAYSQAHPVRNLSVEYPLFSTSAAIVTGEVRLSDFRTTEGGMRADESDQGSEYWTQFKLYLPPLKNGERAPVVIYGHGVSLWKETAEQFVVKQNARKKMATIAVDLPNHGSRIAVDGGYVFEKVSPAGIPRLTGVMLQSTIDNVALVKAVETSLSTLDVLPRRLTWNLTWQKGDGTPDLDVTNLVYEGSSVGGALGTAFAAISPSIKGAFFQAPGFGIMRTISTSWFWDIKAPPLPIKGFGNAAPKSARGSDVVLLVALLQHMVDSGDGANYAHRFSHPADSQKPRPLAMVYGIDDGLVPNHCSESLLRIADLPLLTPVIEPVKDISMAPTLVNGFGALQLNAPAGDPTLHFVAGREEASVLLYQWIDQVVYGGKAL